MAQKRKQTNTAIAGTSIKYQGDLVVKLANGKKILSTKKYHNNGCPPLFRFICNCLAGTFSDTARPSRISLFNIDIDTPADVTIQNFTKDTQVTPFISNDVAAVLNQDGDKVTYHFRIPFTYIQTNSTVNAAALYSRNATETATDACAYFLFTTNNGAEWDPIDFGSLRGNFSLIIEWTMTVSNARPGGIIYDWIN